MVESSIDDFIETCGFQKFGCILLTLVCGVWFLDGIEIAFTSLLAPTLRCDWSLNGLETSLMSTATFLGMGIGSIFIWLPESIRYLQTTGDCDQIMKTLHRISKINNTPLPKQMKIKIKTKNSKDTFKHIYKDHLSSVIASVLMFVCSSVVYYSLTFISAELSSVCYPVTPRTSEVLCNKNDNTEYYQAFVSSLGNIIAPLICIIVTECFGRETIIYTSAVVCMINLIPLSFCLPSYISTGILLLSRPVSSIGIGVIFLLVGETFPTHMRGTVFGICSTVGRWSLIIVSFLIQCLMHYSIPLITFILVVLCIVQMICVYVMPYETFGKVLKE